jgi:uncharacterized protein YndB with AHSA1/START domain
VIDTAKFKPKTVYVTYIAATPEQVWRALTSSDFTRRYFWGRDVELEPKSGGAFALRRPMAASTFAAGSSPTTRRASCR